MNEVFNIWYNKKFECQVCMAVHPLTTIKNDNNKTNKSWWGSNDNKRLIISTAMMITIIIAVKLRLSLKNIVFQFLSCET